MSDHRVLVGVSRGGGIRPLTRRAFPAGTPVVDAIRALVTKASHGTSAREREAAIKTEKALEALGAGISVSSIIDAIERDNPAAATMSTREFTTAMHSALAGMTDEVVAAARAEAKARWGLTYDTTRKAIIDHATSKAAALVVEISDGTRENLRALITRAARDSLHPYDIAPAIRDAVTLHSRWATAVYNYRASLVSSGATPDVVASRTATYYNRLLKVRSQNIARTEILDANNAGKVDAWNQAAADGLFDRATAEKEWAASISDRTCDICSELDGQRVGLDDTFGEYNRPPAHPSCRCTVSLVTDG